MSSEKAGITINFQLKETDHLIKEGLLHKSDERSVAHAALDATSYLTSLVDNHVNIPSDVFTPCEALMHSLSSIDVLEENPDNGKQLYTSAIQLIGSHLLVGCDDCGT